MHTCCWRKWNHHKGIALVWRVAFLLATGFVVTAQIGCASNDGITTRDDRSTRALALRLGSPGCRLSAPLQAADVLRYARYNGVHLRDPPLLEQQLSEGVRSGSEIRLIDCTTVDRERIVEGSQAIIMIKEGKIEEVVIDQMVD